MVTVVALVLTVAVVVFVLYWSGRHGDPNRNSGTSLRRRARSHTTARGRAKVAYASRDAAEASVQKMTRRGSAPLSVYRCDTCAKWHIGH